jgi:hypothetical protein
MSWPSGNLLPCKLNTSSKCYWTEVSVEHFVTACDLSLLLCDFVWDFKTGTCFFLPWECLTPWTLHMCFHPSCFGIQVKDWSLPLFALLLSGSPTSVWFLPTKYDVSPLAHISYHGKLVDPFCDLYTSFLWAPKTHMHEWLWDAIWYIVAEIGPHAGVMSSWHKVLAQACQSWPTKSFTMSRNLSKPPLKSQILLSHLEH